jgi:UvrD/REP helicase N-terminal domain
MVSRMSDYLTRLNPEQRAAVETVEGPLLVLAGAGTGKTRVLTSCLAHILLTGRAYSSQVLAVTFTNKAAREMRERVAAILWQPVEGLWQGTFHALCARMLRRHAEQVGLTPSFTILDADDQLRVLKQVMEAERVDTKRWPAQVLMAVIQRWKAASWQSSRPSRLLEELPEADVERTGALRDEWASSGSACKVEFPQVARRTCTIEAREQPQPPPQAETLPVGSRVFHQRFGSGTIGAAEDERLEVDFDKAGEKRVLNRFVEKA